MISYLLLCLYFLPPPAAGYFLGQLSVLWPLHPPLHLLKRNTKGHVQFLHCDTCQTSLPPCDPPWDPDSSIIIAYRSSVLISRLISHLDSLLIRRAQLNALFSINTACCWICTAAFSQPWALQKQHTQLKKHFLYVPKNIHSLATLLGTPY